MFCLPEKNAPNKRRRGHRLSQSDPLGHGSRQEYNEDGKLVRMVDANNNATGLEYAGVGGSGRPATSMTNWAGCW